MLLFINVVAYFIVSEKMEKGKRLIVYNAIRKWSTARRSELGLSLHERMTLKWCLVRKLISLCCIKCSLSSNGKLFFEEGSTYIKMESYLLKFL